MKIKNIIKNFKLLTESGIRIPKGTRAAKIIHHRDFDGIFSAIVTYRQLLRQGIPAKNIVTGGIQYGDDKNRNEMIKKFSKSKGQMVALVDFARLPDYIDDPDFWSDHHEKSRDKKKTTAGKIGATDFKSDTSHLVYSYAVNLVDGATLKGVDAIDSASFTNLKDVITLKKDFKKKGRLERLAIICNALLVYSRIVDKQDLMDSFIKETQPSLPSFYNNILKYVRLSNIQKEALKELKKDHPNWEMVEKSRNKMPTQESRGVIKRDKKVPYKVKINSLKEGALEDEEELETLKKKGIKRNSSEEKRYRELVNLPINAVREKRETVSKAQKNKKTMESRGSTIIQRATRIQRYIWTQMNKKGLKHPFVIKMYATFIQVSVNPELPSNIKKLIDLNVVRREVMEKITEKYQTKYNKWAFDIIDSESGGHKGITNVSGLGTIGIMKKKDREELRYLESLKKRISNLRSYGRGKLSEEDKEKLKEANKILKRKDTTEDEVKKYTKLKKILMPSMENLMPEKAKKLNELIAKKKETAEIRKKIMEEIKEEFINAFKRKFNASKDIPVMGKNSDIVITGGEEDYQMESIFDELMMK